MRAFERPVLRVAAAVAVAAAVSLAVPAAGDLAGAQDYTPAVVTVDRATVCDEFTVVGTGYPAGGTVAVTFESAPVDLGTATADANGQFTLPALTPRGASGTHTVRAVSGAVEATTAVEVSCAPTRDPASAGALPRTGSSGSLPLARIGVGLVAAGGLAAALGRRRLKRSVAAPSGR